MAPWGTQGPWMRAVNDSGRFPQMRSDGAEPAAGAGSGRRVGPRYRISQAAALLGVSDDTVRRWVDSGRVEAATTDGVKTIPGAALARLAQELAATQHVVPT